MDLMLLELEIVVVVVEMKQDIHFDEEENKHIDYYYHEDFLLHFEDKHYCRTLVQAII